MRVAIAVTPAFTSSLSRGDRSLCRRSTFRVQDPMHLPLVRNAGYDTDFIESFLRRQGRISIYALGGEGIRGPTHAAKEAVETLKSSSRLVMSPEPERRLRKHPHRKTDRKGRVAAQQVVRRCARIDAPTIEVAAVIDTTEMGQRVPQFHPCAEGLQRRCPRSPRALGSAGGCRRTGCAREGHRSRARRSDRRQADAQRVPLTQQDRPHEIAVHER